MYRVISMLLLLVAVESKLFAQSDSIMYEVSTIGVVSSGNKSPFWIQSNRFGEIPYAPHSLLLELMLEKNLSKSDKLFDYNFIVSGHLHEHDKKINLELSQFYAGARVWKFNLGVGARHISYGNQDETLSGGGLLFSSNSAPIPSIQIGIDEFTPFFFKNGFFKIKGGLAHGQFLDNTFVTDMLYHHKFAYVQLGADKSPVRWQYGLDHVAQWGGNIPGYGGQSVDLKKFFSIFMARGGSETSTIDNEQINVAGNHIISQSTRMDVDVNDFSCGLYWQNINEDKPILLLWDAVNIRDGLWGVSIRNNKFPILKGILYEFLNTTDQNGPYHDLDGIVYGGVDSYFNNYLYRSGWTNYGRTIGSPFITSPAYNENGSLEISNNRVQVHHFGLEGKYSGFEFRVLNSYSKNYGTYSAPYSSQRNSMNILIEVNKHFDFLKGIDVGFTLGFDAGTMYGRNSGFMLKLAKSGTLFRLK